jgi:hypothetical protein
MSLKMKTFEEYQAAADKFWADGLTELAEQNYWHALFAYEGPEGNEGDRVVDFEFYLRLADCYVANGKLYLAKDKYDIAMEMVEDDELTTALVFSQRAKMWAAFTRDEDALFDLRSAKKRLSMVSDPELEELKNLLGDEIERQVQQTCEAVYGADMPWPASEPALAVV